jgi:hypothetical protein
MDAQLGRTPDEILRGVIDDAHIADMDLRNRERARQVIQAMGRKWCCFNEQAEHELYMQRMTEMQQ